MKTKSIHQIQPSKWTGYQCQMKMFQEQFLNLLRVGTQEAGYLFYSSGFPFYAFLARFSVQIQSCIHYFTISGSDM